MRLTVGLLTACLVATAAATPATAAPKKKPVPKVCNIIADDPGDAFLGASQVPSDDSVDIVGGDFASNGKKLTGIIRLKALAQQNPRSPMGQVYFVIFKVKGIEDTLTLSAGLYPTGNQFQYGYQAPDPNIPVLNVSYTLGNAVGVINGNEIRITADIANFPQKAFLKNGNSVTTLTAEARYVYGQRVVPSQNVGPVRVPLGGLTARLDDATGKAYVLGAPSCVAVA